jgi:hypothetical protein
MGIALKPPSNFSHKGTQRDTKKKDEKTEDGGQKTEDR